MNESVIERKNNVNKPIKINRTNIEKTEKLRIYCRRKPQETYKRIGGYNTKRTRKVDWKIRIFKRTRK